MSDVQYIRVLYNACYGGFRMSKDVTVEYQNRTGRPMQCAFSRYDIQRRTDPVLLDIYDLFGSEKFSGKYSKICDKKIEAKYLDYIQITEYDGVESVGIRKQEYLVCSILQSDTLTDAEKVQELKKLYWTGKEKKTFFPDDEFDDDDE